MLTIDKIPHKAAVFFQADQTQDYRPCVFLLLFARDCDLYQPQNTGKFWRLVQISAGIMPLATHGTIFEEPCIHIWKFTLITIQVHPRCHAILFQIGLADNSLCLPFRAYMI